MSRWAIIRPNIQITATLTATAETATTFTVRMQAKKGDLVSIVPVSDTAYTAALSNIRGECLTDGTLTFYCDSTVFAGTETFTVTVTNSDSPQATLQ